MEKKSVRLLTAKSQESHFEADIGDRVGAELGYGWQETLGQHLRMADVRLTQLSQRRQADHPVQVIRVLCQLYQLERGRRKRKKRRQSRLCCFTRPPSLLVVVAYLGYDLRAGPLNAEFIHEVAEIGDGGLAHRVDIVHKPIEGEIGKLFIEALHTQLAGNLRQLHDGRQQRLT